MSTIIPTVTFFRLISDAPLPQRADRFADGTIPMRAARHCDAITSAAGFGWLVYPPMDFSLFWDGSQIFWDYPAQGEWSPLDAVQYPGFVQQFDDIVPAEVRGYAPPFLSALSEPGTVQLWTGIIARSAPSWSLLVRAAANRPHLGGFESFEGILESDRWFGPLFTNLRLTRTDCPIRFSRNVPIAQVQPLPRVAYSESTMSDFSTVPTLGGLTDREWHDYRRDVVTPNTDPTYTPGSYAASARRRRKIEHGKACPMVRL